MAHEVVIEDVAAYEAPIEDIAEILASIPASTLAKYHPWIAASLKLTGVYRDESESPIPLHISAISAEIGVLRFSGRLFPEDLY